MDSGMVECVKQKATLWRCRGQAIQQRKEGKLKEWAKSTKRTKQTIQHERRAGKMEAARRETTRVEQEALPKRKVAKSKRKEAAHRKQARAQEKTTPRTSAAQKAVLLAELIRPRACAPALAVSVVRSALARHLSSHWNSWASHRKRRMRPREATRGRIRYPIRSCYACDCRRSCSATEPRRFAHRWTRWHWAWVSTRATRN